MALLGLGFSFGAKDDGLKGHLSDLTESFKKMSKEILSLQRIQTFLAALSLDKLDAFADKIKGLGSSGGMNLTSTLEAEAQQMNASFSKMGAQLGKTGGDLARFAAKGRGLAAGMGIAEDAAGKAVVAFENLAKNKELMAGFKKLGISSTASMAKLGDVLGLDTADFTYKLGLMQKQLGLTGDDIAGIIAQAKAYGDENGNVAGALNSVVEMQGLLLKQQNIFGKSPAEAADFAKSTYALATALQKTGTAGGDAIAKGLAEKLTTTGEEFRKMFSGVQNDLPDLISALHLTGVDSTKVFESMKKGPTEFINEILMMVDEAAKGGQDIKPALKFFSDNMKGVLGEELTNSLEKTLSDSGRRAELITTLHAERAVVATKKTLGGVADAWKSTRTAADQYERMKEGFLQRFRNLSSQTTAQFLKDAGRSFNDFGSLLEKLHKEGGPVGTFISKLADVQKFGAAGLFPPDMQGEMAVLGETFEALSGPLAKMRALGLDLLTPKGILAGAVGFLGARFLSLYAKTKDAEKAFILLEEEVLKFVTETLPNTVSKGVDALAKAARSYLTGGLGAATPNKDKMKDLGMKIIEGIKKGFAAAGDFISEAIDSGVAAFKGQSVDTTKNSSVIGGAIGKLLRSAVEFAKNTVVPFLKDLWLGLSGKVVESVDKDGKTKQTFGNRIGVWIHDALTYVWGFISKFASDLFKGFSGDIVTEVGEDGQQQQTFGNQVGQWLRGAFDVAVQAVKDYFSEWWKRVSAIWDDDSLSFSDKINQIFGESLPILIGAAVLAPGLLTSLAGTMFSLAGSLVGSLGGAFVDLGTEALKPGAKMLGEKAGGWFFEKAMPAITNGLPKLFSSLTGMFPRLLSTLGGLFSGFGQWIMRLGPMLLTGLGTILKGLIAVITSPIGIIVAAIALAFTLLFLAVRKKGDDFQATMERMWEAIRYGATMAWEGIRAGVIIAWEYIKYALKAGWNNIKWFIEDMVDGLKSKVSGMVDMVKGLLLKLITAFATPIASIMNTLGGFLETMVSKLATAADFLGIQSDTLTNLRTLASTLKGVKAEDVIGKARQELNVLDAAETAKSKADAERAKQRARDAERATASSELKTGLSGATAGLAAEKTRHQQASETTDRNAASRAAKGAEEERAARARAEQPAPADAAPPTPKASKTGPAKPAADNNMGWQPLQWQDNAPPTTLSGDDFQTLWKATENPNWTKAYLADLKSRHTEIMAELRRISGGETGGATPGGRVPAPAGRAAKPPIAAGNANVPERS